MTRRKAGQKRLGTNRKTGRVPGRAAKPLSGRTVVVTGGSGFVGSYVVDALAARGARVRNFDLRPPTYAQEAEHMAGDLLDAAALARCCRDADYVYHFAGVADLGDANVRPRRAVEVNVVGAANVLDACRAARARRLLFASSVYVFSRYGGIYRCTKQAAEELIVEYSARFNLPYTILRFGSLYGPRADETNYVHRLVLEGLRRGRLPLYGGADDLREYIHARDAAEIAVDVLAPEYAGRFLTVTGTQAMRRRDLLRMLAEILPGNVRIEETSRDFSEHYAITPYSFHPRVGEKITRHVHVDLGQGLLEVVAWLHDQHQ